LSQLPIESVITPLLEKLKNNQQLILKAPPGAGKSTFLPLTLLRQNWIKGKIVMLEPRRLAAKNIAAYLAGQLGEKVGGQVGYRIRGENRVSADTRLEIVTEGILTRMIQSHPELDGIDLLIFDEFHERSLHADCALAFSLEVQEALRDDLKLLVMSATLDQQALQTLLPQAAYIESHGRSYPVEHRYSPLRTNERVADAIVRKVSSVIENEQGSLLVFLPGVALIKQLCQRLEGIAGDVDICPLYGQLDFAEQQKAIAPAINGKRKIVLATNIAETSLTIEGIRVVIDSGLERVARFDLNSGVTRLEEARIAQSSAEQRAGRAGRLEEGICIRMYSQEQLKQQAKVPQAEILRSDLSSLCLELSQWGATDVQALAWLDTPPSAAVEQGYQLLTRLGITTEEKALTAAGNEMAASGLEPRMAAMLHHTTATKQKTLISCALALVALIEETGHQYLDIAQGIYLVKSARHNKQRVLEKRIKTLAARFRFSFDKSDIAEEAIGVCLAMAYPDRIAQNRGKHSGQFVLANGHGAFISPEEPLSASAYIVAVELMRSQQQASRIFLAAELDIQQLKQQLPQLFTQVEKVDWSEEKGRLVAESQSHVGKLIVSREALPKPDKSKMSQALLTYIRRKGLQSLNWNGATEALLNRYRCAAEWFPDKDWPPLDNKGLLDNLEQWLEPFMTEVSSVKSMQKIDLLAALRAYIGWQLGQEVDALLPTHYQLPTGSRKRIDYQPGKEPKLSVKMQEVFGEQASPLIANGTKKIVLELLSPAQRPLQITSDLAAFWQGAYKEVQKEMKGRYPKHVWPDDPANHIATTKTKRQLKNDK